MRYVDLSKQVDQKPTSQLDPPTPSGDSGVDVVPTASFRNSREEPVRQILFSFYNGELYRILVTYDRYVTEG